MVESRVDSTAIAGDAHDEHDDRDRSGQGTLHAVAMDASGKVVQRRKLGRAKLVEWLANQGPCLIGLEACAGAHHLARTLHAQGHDVRLMPGQYVKPFVKTHKNDLTDAEAIAEAVQRPQMVESGALDRADQDHRAARRAGAAGRVTGWSGCAPR